MRTSLVLVVAILLSIPLMGMEAEAPHARPETTNSAVPVGSTAVGTAPGVNAPPVGTGENEWSGAARPLGRLRHAIAYDSRSDRLVLFGGTSGAADLDDTWTYDFDANTWTDMNPAIRPSARGRHAMAFDSQSNRMILFGGTNAGTLGDTWAYDLGTNTWTNMNPTTRPSPRYRHAMAYDSQSDRIVLFGGTDATVFDDTWAYNFETNTWTNLNPSTRPPARYRHAMAYDVRSDRMVMFGGSNEVSDLDDTWSYDLNTNTWANQNPSTKPSPRSYPAAAYDSESDRVILFGGTGANVLDDTWAYNLDSNSWTDLRPGAKPAARSYPAMAYDSQSDQVVLFGGTSGASDLGDTWAYDLNTDFWMDMNPATRPSVRGRHTMAYDAQSDRMVVFGGFGTGELGDTWAYDLNANRWTSMNPAAPPSARFDSAMVYDSESDRVVLFGGNATGILNETWAYDLNTNTWTNMSPVTPPSARFAPAMAYDSQSDRTILFGGNDGTADLDDTWAYDLNINTWTNLSLATMPSPRHRHAMAYDSQSDRVILFGGTGANVFGTWSYDFETNTWTDMNPAVRPANRYRHTMAYDLRADQIILFGGNNGTAALDDTWAYDVNNNTWTSKDPPDGPSARYRHAAAYDSESERVVLFGGFNPASAALGDTWAFDFNANTWTDVNPATTPSARQLAATVYNSQLDRVVMFGGTGASALLDDTWAYDLNTNRWEDENPAIRPSSRSGHAAAYDSQSDLVVLFGGSRGPAALGDTWVYDLRSNVWTNKNPTTSPPPRSGHAMAYDSQKDRVLLFGGSAGSTFLDDTWAYDVNTNTWTQWNPVPKPLARHRHAMAYDAESARLVLFGGADAVDLFDDTWIYDFDANVWTDLNPATRPAARGRHAMAYDGQSDQIILFGGTGTGTLGDTWAYDLNSNTWQSLSPATRPSPRSHPTLAYDAESDRAILFGGSNGAAVLDDTWTYDLEADTWSNLNPTTKPAPRSRHAMAYDSRSDRVVLFGGVGITASLNDTWSYDRNANTWTNMNPGTSPSARGRHAMEYDAESDRVVLFGGTFGSTVLNDTWMYDLESNTWTNLSPASPPPARSGHRLAYDSRSDRIVLFGGFDPASAELGDTWTFDLNNNTWTNMSPATSPTSRFAHGMAYDSESGRVILFGGLVASVANDETWAYDLNSNTWTALTPATAPSARSDHALAYDVESDRIVLFGGATAGGSSNETWSYDYETDRWANTLPRSSPAARYQHAMAYDAESDRMVLFGGLPFNDETWWYHHPHLPFAPETLEAFAGNAEITLAWRAPASDGGAPVRNYRIYRGITPATETFLIEVSAVLTFTDTALSNGLTYFYQVSGLSAAGEGPRSNEAFATPNPLVPTAPRDLVATAGNSNVSLTWAAPISNGGSPIIGYRIYRGTTSGGETLLLEVGNVTSHTDTGLTNGVTYFYQVGAVNLAGESARSNETNATPVTVPSAARSLTARSGNGQITLDWRAPAFDGGLPVTNYTIYRGSSPGGQTPFLELGDVLSHADTGLTNGVTYYYRVTATNAIGEGPPSNEASGVPRTIPSAARSLAATPGDRQVDLVWASPVSSGGSTITNYRIYRGTTSGAETLLREVGNVLSDTDSGLTNGVTYFYQVSAVNAVGEGPRSNEAAATPNLFLPSAPQNVAASAGDARVSLTWETPSSGGSPPLTGYHIYRGTTSGALSLFVSLGNVLSYNDTAVTNGITYYYGISAVSAAGEGPLSLEKSATPGPLPDTTAPTLTITTPTAGAVLTTSTVSVTGTASDDVGVAKVELSTDGTTWVLATGTTVWSGNVSLVEGSNTIHVRATDTAGNVQSATIVVIMRVEGPGLESTLRPLLLFGAPAAALAGAIIALLILRERRKDPLFRRYGRKQAKRERRLGKH